MKKAYFQPEVTVALFESMTLMQTASPAGEQMGINPNTTSTQW